MKESVNLTIDPSSPDAPVEDQFFKQGVDQELHARYEGTVVEDETRRSRQLRMAATGAIVAVGVVAVGLLIWGGPGAEPPPAIAVVSPAVAAPPAVASPAPPPPAPPAPVAPVAPVTAAATSPGPAPVPAAAPTPPPAAPAAAAAPVSAPALAVVAAPTDDLEQTCRTAFGRKKYRDVLDSCARAFQAKPAAADLAVLVAEAEFDRGRAASALTWARKAVAVDPNLADAYVFIGSAEQQSGRPREAKSAYLKYLELAPGGRFAQDLRSILKTL